jgi:DNA helicase-2/ATP-dependent DNA helicase PcrA
MPFIPTDEQQAILEHDPRRNGVVLAGPGTGKSATLVALIERLTTAREPCRLRLLTFTRAATSELAKKASDHPALAAERPSTVHSFAISTLMRNPGAADFPQPLRIADDWEYKEIVRPTLACRTGVNVRLLDLLMREMESNWQALAPEHSVKISPELRARFLGTWDEHRRIYGYTLLAELPYLLLQALHDHPDLNGIQYHLLLVDEYQDLNACDIEVLQLICARGCALLAAGDDDQSIYSLRKAAPEGIRRFPEDYPGSAQYPLSVTKRCGTNIVNWARFVIEAHPNRPANRPPLRPDPDLPEGEVALLAFDENGAEVEAIAELVLNLVHFERVPPGEILVLHRSDWAGLFSNPVKERLECADIPVADPDVVKNALADSNNRKSLELFRLLVRADDPFAWAALLKLTTGVGDTFSEYIYERARNCHMNFGQSLLESYDQGFPAAPRSARRAAEMIASTRAWLAEQELPADPPEEGWGHWLVESAGDAIAPAFGDELADIICELDDLTEPASDLGRFLGQISPLGTDLSLARTCGVRFMTMAGSKGLTVEATIIAAAEEGLVPRPEADRNEERRLLYVAMTRAKRFLFATWSRRRHGPTARAGAPNVGERRTYSAFFRGGPVTSQDGAAFLLRRWPTGT